MADEQLSLTLAFINQHPDDAARALELHDLPLVARFLTGLPQDDANLLTRRLLPQYVARLCGLFSDKEAAGLLDRQELSYTAAVLRSLNVARREAILALLPARRRTTINLLLSFSSDTVGAWQTPHVATIPSDCNVNEALHHLRIAGEDTQSEQVFAVDRDRFVRGRVRNLDLLRADPQREVATLLEASLGSLPGRLSLTRAAEHADWATADVMPVNNRRLQFIGAIRHVDLRRGLEVMKADLSGRTRQPPLGGLLEIYGDSMLALFNSVGDTFDADDRNQGND